MVIIDNDYVQKALQGFESNSNIEWFAILFQKIQLDIFGSDNTYSLEMWQDILKKIGDEELNKIGVREILGRISLDNKNPKVKKDIEKIAENIQIVYFRMKSQKY